MEIVAERDLYVIREKASAAEAPRGSLLLTRRRQLGNCETVIRTLHLNRNPPRKSEAVPPVPLALRGTGPVDGLGKGTAEDGRLPPHKTRGTHAPAQGPPPSTQELAAADTRIRLVDPNLAANRNVEEGREQHSLPVSLVDTVVHASSTLNEYVTGPVRLLCIGGITSMLERELAPSDGDDRLPWMGMPPSEPTCIKGELGDHDIATALDSEVAKVADVARATHDLDHVRLIGGQMITLHAYRWGLGAALFRETKDADVGITEAIARDEGIVARLEAVDYRQRRGGEFVRTLKEDSEGNGELLEATIDVLVPARTSRARESRRVSHDLVTTEVPGLATALARPAVRVALSMTLLDGTMLEAISRSPTKSRPWCCELSRGRSEQLIPTLRTSGAV